MKIIIFHNPTENFIYRGDPVLKNLIPKNKSLFYSQGSGLPIGNLTSQFFANVYMDVLDHFIVEELGFKYYVRYVDDFVIVDVDQYKLRALISKVECFLQTKLKLHIHPRKIILQEIRKGVDFLGYFIKPSHILVRQKVVRRFKKRLHQNIDKDGLLPVSNIPMIQSYLGHFGHANSFRLKRHLCGE